MEPDELDRILKQSDPASQLSVAERRTALMLVDRSRPAKLPRLSRPIAIGMVSALLLGGGGVVAAAATGLWDGWAEDDPLAILHYSLPSGASCEWRIGNVQGAPAEVEKVIRESLADAMFSDDDVARAVADLGVNTDPMKDDVTYQTGYNWAVVDHVEEALDDHGLDGKWASFSGQGVCQ